MKLHYAIALGAAALLSFDVSAQSMKPGLWEMTHTVKGGGGSTEMDKARAQAQEKMANMSPEQRKMMEEMMAKRGMQMGTGPGGPMSIKTCMTKEMVERNEMPSQKGDCKATKHERSGNKLKVAYTCSNSSGEGEYTFTSPEAFSMKMTMHMMSQGKQETMNMEGSGKWLSADCGSIKPPVYPPKK